MCSFSLKIPFKGFQYVARWKFPQSKEISSAVGHAASSNVAKRFLMSGPRLKFWSSWPWLKQLTVGLSGARKFVLLGSPCKTSEWLEGGGGPRSRVCARSTPRWTTAEIVRCTCLQSWNHTSPPTLQNSGTTFKNPPIFPNKCSIVRGVGRVPKIYMGVVSWYFCELGGHANFGTIR